jgi:hypothetical protein
MPRVPKPPEASVRAFRRANAIAGPLFTGTGEHMDFAACVDAAVTAIHSG